MSFIKVLTAVTSNSNSSTYNFNKGEGQVVVAGTWVTATVKLQMSPDGGTTWVDAGSASTFTADGISSFALNACKVRVNVSSVGASSSVNAWISTSISSDLYI
jgi:predicted amidohydrolase